MDREEVIRIYKQVSKELCHGDKWVDSHMGKQLHRFAELVAEAEREECAKIADQRWIGYKIAKAIRARGET